MPIRYTGLRRERKNSQCWQGCGEKDIPRNCWSWWECKLRYTLSEGYLAVCVKNLKEYSYLSTVSFPLWETLLMKKAKAWKYIYQSLCCPSQCDFFFLKGIKSERVETFHHRDWLGKWPQVPIIEVKYNISPIGVGISSPLFMLYLQHLSQCLAHSRHSANLCWMSITP